MSNEATVDRGPTRLWRWSPAVTLLILYGIAQVAADIGHGIHEASEGGGFDVEEVVRQKLLLDELIFNNGSPEDPDQFQQMIKRAILYGGVAVAVIARAINVSERSLHNYEDGTSLPYEHKRRAIIEKIRAVILGL